MKKRDYARGSNQYVKKHRGLKQSTWESLLVLIGGMTVFTMIMGYCTQQVKLHPELVKQVDASFISPLPSKAAGVKKAVHTVPVAPTATPDPTNPVVAYINEVFGTDAPKAFKLLSCENSALNPEQVNTAGNSPAGSRDIGVFQINEYWQAVNAKFLFDYRVNTDMAYHIFYADGKSFRQWTCGRKFNI